jgi:hypothetical protein
VSWQEIFDLLGAVTAVIAVLIWPLVIYFIARLFRAEVSRLIDRVRGGKILGAEIDASHRQTPESAEKTIDELKGLAGGKRIEPTIGRPDDRAKSSQPTTIVDPAGVTPDRESTPLQAIVEKSIRDDPLIKDRSDSEKVAILIQAQAAVQMQVTFERIYRLIFGSQTQALSIAAAHAGAQSAALRRIFYEAKFKFPDLYRDWEYKDWFAFLFNAGLARENSGIVRTTSIGEEYLNYVTAMKYPDKYG